MNRPVRRLKRPLGKRRYRKIFIIATEGGVTEPQYFNMFNSNDAVVHIKCLKNIAGRSPRKVLSSMKRYIRDKGLEERDAAWLVVDKDQWSDDQLLELHRWSQEKLNYGFALSNPKFEYWLLLHFEDGSGVTGSSNCIRRLRRHLPNFNKGNIKVRKLRPYVPDAIQRARQKDTPPCKEWPQNFGSTVYRLAEELINVGSE